MMETDDRTLNRSRAGAYHEMTRLPSSDKGPDENLLTIINPEKEVSRSALDDMWDFAIFLAILPTTILSVVLLIANLRQWTVPPTAYTIITSNRATVQLVVQVLATVLGFCNVAVVLKLINCSTRLRLAARSMSLNTLRFLNALLSQQMSMRLPLHLCLALFVCLILAVVPASLWAGAITPVAVVITRPASVLVPSYADTTMLVYNWTQRSGLPAAQTARGLFTFNVGERHQGRLLESASTASPVDGRPLVHQKLDNTGFSYVGRSYGVGMSAGLMDDTIALNPFATGYSYHEPGYASSVSCDYNSSSAFYIQQDVHPGKKSWEIAIWNAVGRLPNSGNVSEWSRYPGFDADNIVAIGVATVPSEPRKMLAIAAGAEYKILNNTQCEWTFRPTLFKVTVSLVGRNITVEPVPGVAVADIEPVGNLTFLANWQFTLISSDQTSLYSSLVGSSFNASIENCIAAVNPYKYIPSQAEVALAGITDSLTVMMDDILTGYAGAQLIVANVTRPAEAIVQVRALVLGQQVWILAAAVLNLVVLAFLIVEAVRTRGWWRLERLDYMDPVDLIHGLARGFETGDATQVSSSAAGRIKLRPMNTGLSVLELRSDMASGNGH